MVSVNPNPPPQGFYLFDPTNMNLPGLNSMPRPTQTCTTSTTKSSASQFRPKQLVEDQSKKIRKPYTITKSRESWSDQEHEKFLEALQLFDRDWKKIEAFVGSKTVIQIRSHAQKYFLKVQKKGTSEHVPPPRPKRKATHPYPQKAPKTAPVVSQVVGPFESSSAVLEHGYTYQPDSSFVHGTPVTSATLSSWSHRYVPPVNASQISKDGGSIPGSTDAQNACYGSSNESKPATLLMGETFSRACHRQPQRVLPDFAQVYKFIGSVFDPDSTSHLERLKQMDPINLETALLLMRNLSINLTSPEFEDYRRLLLSYDADSEKAKPDTNYNFAKPDTNYNFSCHGKSENAILST